MRGAVAPGSGWYVCVLVLERVFRNCPHHVQGHDFPCLFGRFWSDGCRSQCIQWCPSVRFQSESRKRYVCTTIELLPSFLVGNWSSVLLVVLAYQRLPWSFARTSHCLARFSGVSGVFCRLFLLPRSIAHHDGFPSINAAFCYCRRDDSSTNVYRYAPTGHNQISARSELRQHSCFRTHSIVFGG